MAKTEFAEMHVLGLSPKVERGLFFNFGSLKNTLFSCFSGFAKKGGFFAEFGVSGFLPKKKGAIKRGPKKTPFLKAILARLPKICKKGKSIFALCGKSLFFMSPPKRTRFQNLTFSEKKCEI